MMTKRDFLIKYGDRFYAEKAHVFELLFAGEEEWPAVRLLDEEAHNPKTGARRYGLYLPYEKEVIIYVRSFDDPDRLIETLWHECRHHWQYLRFPEICLWWSKHAELYKRAYPTLANPMEEDARGFAKSRGEVDYTLGNWLFVPEAYESQGFESWLSSCVDALRVAHSISKEEYERSEEQFYIFVQEAYEKYPS